MLAFNSRCLLMRSRANTIARWLLRCCAAARPARCRHLRQPSFVYTAKARTTERSRTWTVAAARAEQCKTLASLRSAFQKADCNSIADILALSALAPKVARLLPIVPQWKSPRAMSEAALSDLDAAGPSEPCDAGGSRGKSACRCANWRNASTIPSRRVRTTTKAVAIRWAGRSPLLVEKLSTPPACVLPPANRSRGARGSDRSRRMLRLHRGNPRIACCARVGNRCIGGIGTAESDTDAST